MTEAPQYPVGALQVDEKEILQRKDELISQIEQAPGLLRQTLQGLTEEQLNTKYKNWSIKQIVNHLADSHVNSYVRFRWTLTEATPTIKAYDENLLSDLPDAKNGNLEPSLTMLDGIHQRWVRLLHSMTDEQFGKAFIHPDGRTITLTRALGIYAWHCRHHTGQVLWLRENRFC